MNHIIANKKKINNLFKYDTDIIIHSNIDTIKKLQEGYSIARYGDGEFLMMINKDMLYEKYDETLKNRLIEVITQNDNHNLLLGIPKMYFYHDAFSSQTIRGKMLYNYWNKNIRKYIPENMHLFNKKDYYSSFFTQLYAYDDEYNKKLFDEIVKIWNQRTVVLYMNDNIYKYANNVINNIFKNSTKLIHESVPETKAWSKYDNILDSVKKYDINYLILICCGATATIFAYDASKLGYQVIDMGQFIEDLITKENIFTNVLA